MSTRAIIICAGEATRWNGYLNTPKHLIKIEGERLLDRTVRLLSERGVQEIFTVVKEKTPTYHVDGAVQYKAKLNPEKNVDADKFLSSRELWNEYGRTIVIYGDCYFTEEAMDTIVSFPERDWQLFCRPEASEVTGTPWGECFAFSFYPEHHADQEEKLNYIAELYKAGTITRCGGWEHYRALTGRKGIKVRRPHKMTDHYTEINDWTDDFDFPGDFIEWTSRRAKAVV